MVFRGGCCLLVLLNGAFLLVVLRHAIFGSGWCRLWTLIFGGC